MERMTLLAGLGAAAVAGSLALSGTAAAAAATGAAARPAAVHHVVPGSVYAPAHRTLKWGMRGPAVTALQQRLHYLHYWVGKINGYFGWDLQEAVASWRRPDGVGWFTPGGFHRAIHYIPGKVADNSFGTSYMYWPVFFIGYTYAIHGFPNPKWHNRFYGVPLKPASHGCVRIPLDLSKVLHRHLTIGPYGTPIWIYPVSGPALAPGEHIRWLRPGRQDP